MEDTDRMIDEIVQALDVMIEAMWQKPFEIDDEALRLISAQAGIDFQFRPTAWEKLKHRWNKYAGCPCDLCVRPARNEPGYYDL